MCGACLPGYQPTKNTDLSPFVSACTAITNCDTKSTYFNMCSKC